MLEIANNMIVENICPDLKLNFKMSQLFYSEQYPIVVGMIQLLLFGINTIAKDQSTGK